jgi:hypothetical protein
LQINNSMMKQHRSVLISRIVVAACLIIGSNNYVKAQINQRQLAGQRLNAITTAMPLLLIAPDSRAGGMGDAGVATTPDANATHWNPAKLAFIESKNRAGISLSYIPWLRQLVPDINISYLSGYYKIDNNQTIAGSLLFNSLGDITFTSDNGDVLGNFKPNEFAFSLYYSRKLSDYFSGGIGAKYLYSNLTMGQFIGGIETRAAMSVAADISAYYTNPDIQVFGTPATIAAGLNISNIGAKMAYSATGRRDFIPINMRLGPALTLRPDDYNAITFTFDAVKLLVPTPPIYDPLGRDIIAGRDPDVGVAGGIFGSFSDAPGEPVRDEQGNYVLNPDGTAQIRPGSVAREELREINFATGIEYWYDKQFALRAGYFHESEQKGNRKFFTFGAGLRYNVFGLDLAYIVPMVQRHPLANTLRFTLTLNFEGARAQN